jgi:hypothetical protein
MDEPPAEATPTLKLDWSAAPGLGPTKGTGSGNPTAPGCPPFTVSPGQIEAAENALLQAVTQPINTYNILNEYVQSTKSWIFLVGSPDATLPSSSAAVQAYTAQNGMLIYPPGNPDNYPTLSDATTLAQQEVQALRGAADAITLVGQLIAALNDAAQSYASTDLNCFLQQGLGLWDTQKEAIDTPTPAPGPGQTVYDSTAVTISVDPVNLFDRAAQAKVICDDIGNQTLTITNTLSGLALSWDAQSAADMQNIVNQLTFAANQLFSDSGMINTFLIAAGGAADNYGQVEAALLKSYAPLQQALDAALKSTGQQTSGAQQPPNTLPSSWIYPPIEEIYG